MKVCDFLTTAVWVVDKESGVGAVTLDLEVLWQLVEKPTFDILCGKDMIF